MRIWIAIDPNNAEDYARARPYGRRAYENFELGLNVGGEPEEFILEWEPDSDVVGDFTWPAVSSWVVTRREIGEALRARWPSLVLGPIGYWQDPKLYRLKRKPKKPRVLLPYAGPEQVYFKPTVFVPFDRERSRVREMEDSNGNTYFRLQGVETFDFSNGFGKLARRIPREAGGGYFLPEDEVKRAGLFLIEKSASFHLYVSDEVKDFIEENAWSNIDFLEHGETY